MKIATWNVNSIRSRLAVLLDWLREERPDIVLLQETKVEDAHFPREPLEDLGYNLGMWGQKTYNGVAILSRFPLEDLSTSLSPELQEARYIEAFTGGFRVASIYVPNGQEVGSPKYAVKEAFFKALQKRAQELLAYDEALILGGDYNVAPGDADVWDPQAWRERILCSTPERQWFRSLVYLGLTDALDHVPPDGDAKNPYTWWDYRQQGFARQHGLRIDHLLLSPLAADRLQNVQVGTFWRGVEKTSDHAPLVGVFA